MDIERTMEFIVEQQAATAASRGRNATTQSFLEGLSRFPAARRQW
jgi:hypothetical protein